MLSMPMPYAMNKWRYVNQYSIHKYPQNGYHIYGDIIPCVGECLGNQSPSRTTFTGSIFGKVKWGWTCDQRGMGFSQQCHHHHIFHLPWLLTERSSKYNISGVDWVGVWGTEIDSLILDLSQKTIGIFQLCSMQSVGTIGLNNRPLNIGWLDWHSISTTCLIISHGLTSKEHTRDLPVDMSYSLLLSTYLWPITDFVATIIPVIPSPIHIKLITTWNHSVMTI